KGNTPLHYAARAECTEAVRMLLELGSYLGHLNILGVPPIAHINQEILHKHFDECLQSNNECTDEYEINFDYTCLIPQTTSPSEHEEIRYDSLLRRNSVMKLPLNPEMYVVHYIALDRSLKNLLKHPLLSSGSENNDFPNPGQSLFKTIIMVTGEFNATDIPFVLHPVFSHIVFILFVFLIAIVLFNLLIGLAVSDTADILSKAELVGLISRTKLICYAENIVLGSSIMKSPKCWNMLYKNQIFRIKFFAQRVLLFPHYLLQAKIIVKPYKDNKIYIFACNDEACNNTSLKMDPKIISKSRQILSARGKITEYEKIMNALQKLELDVINLTDIMNSLQSTADHNK
ncbi:hypothetical protein PV327_011225, partial [Microctonus hyperodae]